MTVPSPEREPLVHFLGAIAYRGQKAIRGAPDSFWTFSPGNQVRTPADILRHMTSVLGYARTFMLGGAYPRKPAPLPTMAQEIQRFHDVLEDLAGLLRQNVPLNGITEKQLLQGPLSDVMTHIGQLAILRRLHGSPIPPENFLYADVSPDRLGPDQPPPARPDDDWPERPS